MSAIAAYLRCLQTITFHLKTGFGLVTQGYSRVKLTPFMGLIQRSGDSLPVWTAVSTLIINVHYCEGHGVSLQSGCSNKWQEIAAILFVKDTDLLDTSSALTYNNAQFIQEVQESTSLWAELLQATGGNIKPALFYYYLTRRKFEKGAAQLRTLTELSQLIPMKKPQPNPKSVQITHEEVTEESKTLGVFTSPKNLDDRHFSKMLDKAKLWTSGMITSHLSPIYI